MKTNYMRLTALILSLLMALGMFAGCNAEKNVPQEAPAAFADALGRTVTPVPETGTGGCPDRQFRGYLGSVRRHGLCRRGGCLG